MRPTRHSHARSMDGGVASVLGLIMLAGSAHADPDGPRVGPKTIAERHVAHIYYNLATDERIATLIDPGVRPADNGVSPAVWITGNSFPC